MICIKALALILLFVSYVFGAGENCFTDEHCGPGEKCFQAEERTWVPVPMKKCKKPIGIYEGPLIPAHPERYCKNRYDCDWYLGEECNMELNLCAKLLKLEDPWERHQKDAKSSRAKPGPRSDKSCKHRWSCKWWKGEKCVEGKCQDGNISKSTPESWVTPFPVNPIPLPTPKPKCKTCKSRFNCKWWRLQKCVDGCCKSRKG